MAVGETTQQEALNYCTHVQLSALSHYFIPLGPNILLRTLLSNTISLCPSPNGRDQVSHPYKTTGRIMVLTFMFLDSRQKDRRF
jgi:hypothetical protein